MTPKPAGRRPRGSPITYGTPQLDDLCVFGADLRLWPLSRALLRRPERSRELLGLSRLPVVEVRLTTESYGRWMACVWPAGEAPVFAGHWAQAVIGTPADESEYLTGRHRQALRTNIRRASELGITASRLEHYDEFAVAASSVYRARLGGDAVLATLAPPSGAENFAWYAAYAPDRDDPIAVAVVAIFGELGALVVMVGDRRFGRLGHTRHLLHTFILRDLADTGVRHLVAGSVLRESPGNRYFQRLLGYRVCNLRPILVDEASTTMRAAVRRRLMRGPVVSARSWSERRAPVTAAGATADTRTSAAPRRP